MAEKAGWPGRLFLLTVALVLMVVHHTHGQGVTLQYHILEELPAGTLIGNVAIDAKLTDKYSSTDVMKLRYSFLEQPDLDLSHFAIDEKSGIIRTKEVPNMKEIDRDRLCPQTSDCIIHLDIAVGPADYFQVINVKVEVMDVNDNRPIFAKSEVSYSISESTSPGTSIGLPTATDPDSADYSIQSYELMSNSTAFELKETLSYDETPELKLVLKERLDREKIAFYQLKVVAYDGGHPSKSGSILINISVTDANDNSPVFVSQSYEVDIVEDAPVNSTIIQVQAFDDDEGLNGEVFYSFTSRTNDHFGHILGLDAQTGEVFLKQHLDYETATLYQLIVRAQDLGADSQPSHCTVILHIQDVNDNSPQITVNTLTASGIAQISEASEPGTFVAHISAVDHDAGPSGDLTCALDDENLFRLEHLYKTQYKMITRAKLDREVQSEYELKLSCYDMGQPSMLTTQIIHITVLDVNDHAPQFAKPSYSANVPENNRVGAFIIRVNATDKDQDANGEIEYKLSAEVHQYFAIDSKFGIISAKKNFDHEQMKDVTFVVIAEDHGTPVQTGTVEVTVNINDVNDMIPAFQQMSYSFGVLENKPAHSEVGYVTAIDGDSPPYDHTEYSLGSMEGKDAFTIEVLSGRIKTTKRLDREQTSIYQLNIVASNPGFPGMSSTCGVVIHVGDVNDNYPIIDYPEKTNTSVQVSNRIPKGYVVSRVRGHDLDIGDNGMVSYSIASGNIDKLFIMHPETGALSTTKEMKHISLKSYPLRIEVSDYGRPPRVNVTVINVVVNFTIPYNPPAMVIPHPGDELEDTTGSMIIVIGLSAASAFVLLLLILLLVYIRRQSTQRKRHTYRCRGETQKMLRRIEGKDGGSPQHLIIQDKQSSNATNEFIFKPRAVLINNKQQQQNQQQQQPHSPYKQHHVPVRMVGDGGVACQTPVQTVMDHAHYDGSQNAQQRPSPSSEVRAQQLHLKTTVNDYV